MIQVYLDAVGAEKTIGEINVRVNDALKTLQEGNRKLLDFRMQKENGKYLIMVIYKE